MSNLRHFLFPDGRVRSSTGYTATQLASSSSGATEVQVVPVDAIVIRREELPEVYPNSEGPGYEAKHPDADSTWVNPSILGAEFMRGRGLECIALAEYLREHQPVDEAQVAAITALIDEDEHWGEDGDSSTIARRLVERGVRVEQS